MLDRSQRALRLVAAFTVHSSQLMLARWEEKSEGCEQMRKQTEVADNGKDMAPELDGVWTTQDESPRVDCMPILHAYLTTLKRRYSVQVPKLFRTAKHDESCPIQQLDSNGT